MAVITTDRATGNKPSSDIDITQVTGPDAKTDSAIRIATSKSLVYPTSVSATGDFTILLWLKDIDTSANDVLSIGTSILSFPSTTSINFFDGTNNILHTIPTPTSSIWYSIRVTRISGIFTIQMNSSADSGDAIESGVDTTPGSVETVSGVVTLVASSTGLQDIFDVRFISEGINKTIFDYYRSDVENLDTSSGFGGQKVLPSV